MEDDKMEILSNIETYLSGYESVEEGSSLSSTSSGFFLMESIGNSINKKIYFNRTSEDYFEIINERYSLLASMHSGDDERLSHMNKQRRELYILIANKIFDSLGFSPLEHNGDFEGLLVEDFAPTIQILYNFFVLDYKEHLIELFYKYIKFNKDVIYRTLFGKTTPNKKDLEYVNFQSEMADKKMASIVYGIDVVIKHCTNELKAIDGIELIKELINIEPDEVNTYFIKNYFVKNEIFSLDDDFQDKFFKSYDNYEHKDSITTEIMLKLKMD